MTMDKSLGPAIELGTPCWVRWGRKSESEDWIYKKAFFQAWEISHCELFIVVLLEETHQADEYSKSLVYFTDPRIPHVPPNESVGN